MEYIGISISDEKLILSAIGTGRKCSNIAYSVYDISQVSVINGIIFNITYLEDLIKKFSLDYKIKSNNIIISINNSTIQQQIFQNFTQSNYKKLELSNLDSYFIKTQELQFYPSSIFYQAAIINHHIFQYNLLAINLGFNLSCLTTDFISWYYFYKVNCSKVTIEANANLSIDYLRAFFRNVALDKVKFLKEELCLNIEHDDLMTIYGMYYLYIFAD